MSCQRLSCFWIPFPDTSKWLDILECWAPTEVSQRRRGQVYGAYVSCNNTVERIVSSSRLRSSIISWHIYGESERDKLIWEMERNTLSSCILLQTEQKNPHYTETYNEHRNEVCSCVMHNGCPPLSRDQSLSLLYLFIINLLVLIYMLIQPWGQYLNIRRKSMRRVENITQRAVSQFVLFINYIGQVSTFCRWPWRIKYHDNRGISLLDSSYK
jgi:hypothetical protein